MPSLLGSGPYYARVDRCSLQPGPNTLQAILRDASPDDGKLGDNPVRRLPRNPYSTFGILSHAYSARTKG